jgi:hypothetical protein
VTTELLVGLIAVSAVFAVGRGRWPGITEPPLFILAHQVRGVSSENNRPDTYPTEFAQVSGVQSVKHLVCKCHHTTERRVGYSWRHIGLKEASALPQHTVPHLRERISGPPSQNEKASRCFEPAAHERHVRPPDISGTPHSSYRFCSKFMAGRFAIYLTTRPWGRRSSRRHSTSREQPMSQSLRCSGLGPVPHDDRC